MVTGPSSVNTSTFYAETFVMPGDACEQVHPHAKTAPDDNTNPSSSSRLADLLTPVRALPPGSRLRESIALPVRALTPWRSS